MEIFSALPEWFPPTMASAVTLGIYDIAKKHAVRENSVTTVLLLTSLCGCAGYLLLLWGAGTLFTALRCDGVGVLFLFMKSALVALSWGCLYFGLRTLPISIVSPIRASSPLWTFAGSLVLFGEVPSWLQALAMAMIFAGYWLFSVLGKIEKIDFWRNPGMRMVFAGTLLGSAAALYDKYLLSLVQLPRGTVQAYFMIFLVVILGAVFVLHHLRARGGAGAAHRFIWRWSIPMVGLLVVLADWFYFYALTVPDPKISIISLVRRSSCIITFIAGGKFFGDVNLKPKAAVLALILLGIVLLAVGG